MSNLPQWRGSLNTHANTPYNWASVPVGSGPNKENISKTFHSLACRYLNIDLSQKMIDTHDSIPISDGLTNSVRVFLLSRAGAELEGGFK